MKQLYVPWRPNKETKQLVAFINGLIDSYLAQGFKLSVRQLYYQLVARDMIANTEQSYKRVASIINDGRLAGLIDWDAIEDRNRDIEQRPRWISGSQLLDLCAKQFHMDLWQGQQHRVFVIVEKAALGGVLDGVCRKWDVPLLAARGYPSVSIVREMVMDHLRPAARNNQLPIVLHLGDHDPSGIDMTRDLQDRFQLFMGASEFELRRIALTRDQIDETNAPPNPAKTTDARFRNYAIEHGDESWELDALEPSYLVQLVEGHIESAVDDVEWQARVQQIEYVRDRLQEVADTFDQNT